MKHKIIFHKWQCNKCKMWMDKEVKRCVLCKEKEKFKQEVIRQRKLDKRRKLKNQRSAQNNKLK